MQIVNVEILVMSRILAALYKLLQLYQRTYSVNVTLAQQLLTGLVMAFVMKVSKVRRVEWTEEIVAIP